MVRFAIILVWFFLFPIFIFGQSDYYMSNETVTACEGFFFDSNEGLIEDHYAHNENLTFSICIPGAEVITMIFSEFCTEAGFDFIRFFDGPDTMSPQIGPAFSGIAIPPPVVANSGCLTIHFISDASVSCTGWAAYWFVDMEIPEAADIIAPATMPCNSNSLTIQFDSPVPCNELTPVNFSITGPQNPTVTQVIPVNCVNGMASAAQLQLSGDITQGGYYDVHFAYEFTDACDTVWYLESFHVFGVLDCPIEAFLYATPNPICDGDCTTLTAVATGGDPAAYIFSYSPVVSGSGSEVQACPAETTTYDVTVSDANGLALPGSASVIVTVQLPPQITVSNPEYCRTNGPVALTATPGSGTWSGNGITDAAAGIFDPIGIYDPATTVSYSYGVCIETLDITILPVDAGNNDAACHSTVSFTVSGGTPAGGSWNGPGINAAGVFTITVPGSFDVTYTAPNGCSDVKTVIVDTLTLDVPDSICSSLSPFDLSGTPPGGIWSSTGTGLTNAVTGSFDPELATEGMQTITYTLTDGCAGSHNLYVSEIDAGNNITACPDQAPFIMSGNPTPAGGVWSGPGILDPITGLFSPAGMAHGFNAIVTYTVNGCSDTRQVRIRNTTLSPPQAYNFCLNSSALHLNDDNTGRNPGGGTWSGPGVYNPSGNQWYFNPAVAGPGTHTLTYTVNTCSDNMTVTVHPDPTMQSATTCVQASPVILTANPPGGYFTGPGITQPYQGVFSPSQAGSGVHLITYTSPAGCTVTGTVNVTPQVNPSLVMESPYCHRDSMFPVNFSPTGGVLSGPGTVSNNFNPALAGQGVHMITYTTGSGECASSTTVPVNVFPPLQIFLPEYDPVCSGSLVYLRVDSVKGGIPQQGGIDFFWNQGLGFGQTHLIYPTINTTYTVTATDYCSDPAVASVSIPVSRALSLNFISGPEVCYGDTTHATALVFPPDEYQYQWSYGTSGPDHMVFGLPGTYSLTVTDPGSGCTTTGTVQLPGYQAVVASFSPSPFPQPCVGLLSPDVTFIDQSIGSVHGFWYVNGQVVQPYEYGIPLQHSFTEAGNHTISLIARNAGYCADTMHMDICVVPEHRIFLPNAFAPGGTGNNSRFVIRTLGVDEAEWKIYDRWGRIIYESADINSAWDGQYRGSPVPQGVYVVHVKYRAGDLAGWGEKKGFVTVIY